MASIVSDPNGRKRIQFMLNGVRKTLRLGKASKRQAEAIKVRVEQLALTASGLTNLVDGGTVRWLSGLNNDMYEKLVAVGLVASRPSTPQDRREPNGGCMIGVREAAANAGLQGVPRLALKAPEAAKALGISEKILWKWVETGIVPFIYISGVRLFPVKALEEWLMQRIAAENAKAQAPAGEQGEIPAT